MTPFEGVELKANPEQTASVMLEMEGLGLTETVMVKGVPPQVPDVGVTE